MAAQPELWVVDLGRLPYAAGLALQERVRDARERDVVPDTLLLLEHDPVYTRGRRADPAELPLGEDWYAERGIAIVDVDRGGRVTYHAPGQLVGYPIVRTDDVVAHVRGMERRDHRGARRGGRRRALARRRGLRLHRRLGARTARSARSACTCAAAITTHGFARQRRHGPRAVDVDRPVRADAADDVARRRDRAHRAARPVPAPARRARLRDAARPAPAPRHAGPPGPRPDRRDPGASVSDVSLPPAEREHRTRGRSNPGGMDVLQVLGTDVQPIRARKPPWFKVPAPGGVKYRELSKLISDENLHTVCQEAACPNVGECWERGTATFMILGDTCTRRCGFCNVTTGKPTWNDPLEPARVARSIARMGLRHAVITSVDRDDLPDLGSRIWAATIRQCRRQAPDCQVEVLTPDFRGEEMPLATVLAERPDVFNHNVEVVPRLYPRRAPRLALGALAARAAQREGDGRRATSSRSPA